MTCSRCNFEYTPAFQPEKVSIETSNPGHAGHDTGHVFRSARTGGLVRVMAKAGESFAHATSRVRARHGMR